MKNTYIEGIPGVCTFEISNAWGHCTPTFFSVRWFKNSIPKDANLPGYVDGMPKNGAVFEIRIHPFDKCIDTSVPGLIDRLRNYWDTDRWSKCVFVIEEISKHSVAHAVTTDTLNGYSYSVYVYAIKNIGIEVLMYGPGAECVQELEAIMRTFVIQDVKIDETRAPHSYSHFCNKHSLSNVPSCFFGPSGILGVGSLVIPDTWRRCDIGETCIFAMDTCCASLSKTDISTQPIEVSRHTEKHALLEAYANMERAYLESCDDTYKESRNWESLYKYTALHIVGVSLMERKVSERYVYVQDTMIVTVAAAWEYDNALAAKFARMVLQSYCPETKVNSPVKYTHFL